MLAVNETGGRGQASHELNIGGTRLEDYNVPKFRTRLPRENMQYTISSQAFMIGQDTPGTTTDLRPSPSVPPAQMRRTRRLPS